MVSHTGSLSVCLSELDGVPSLPSSIPWKREEKQAADTRHNFVLKRVRKRLVLKVMTYNRLVLEIVMTG